MFLRSVKPEVIAEHYRQALIREGIPYGESNAGSFDWDFPGVCFSMTFHPGNKLNAGKARRFSARGAQVTFPPPELLAELYAGLKGSVNKQRFRGFAYALGGRQSGKPAWPDNPIPRVTGSAGLRGPELLEQLLDAQDPVIVPF